MNDSPLHHRHPSTTHRPASALAVSLLLVLVVPLALWALSNPLLAALLGGTGVLAVAVVTRRRSPQTRSSAREA